MINSKSISDANARHALNSFKLKQMRRFRMYRSMIESSTLFTIFEDTYDCDKCTFNVHASTMGVDLRFGVCLRCGHFNTFEG